jgi:hypothetical protein
MKGILKKAAKGWFVWFDTMREDGVISGYDSLPVYQSEFSVSEKQPIIPLENDKQVEFDILRYCPYHKCSPFEPKGCTLDCAYTEIKYAKLIEKDTVSDQTFIMKDENGIFYEMKTNAERFDEFMEGLNQPPYPELEGTLEVCKDIINLRSSEISDEKINQASFNKESVHWHGGFFEGAIWYREQLNLRN